MTARAWKFAALFVGAFIVGLVALFPAALATRWFAPPVPGLVLGGANGTIWNGSISSLEYRGLDLGRAEWSVNPLALFTLSLAVDLAVERPDGAPLTATLNLSPSGRIEIENFRGAVRLADLVRARLMPANLASGEAIFDLARVEMLDGRILAAEGRAGLTALESTLLPGVALGSYEAQLETTPDNVVARFSEIEAPLRLNGLAELEPDGSYVASGAITPSAETPENLRRGLALLGQPDASGRYEFRFQGQL